MDACFFPTTQNFILLELFTQGAFGFGFLSILWVPESEKGTYVDLAGWKESVWSLDLIPGKMSQVATKRFQHIFQVIT